MKKRKMIFIEVCILLCMTIILFCFSASILSSIIFATIIMWLVAFSMADILGVSCMNAVEKAMRVSIFSFLAFSLIGKIFF